ncbi:hypothetical protein [Luteitalea sp.]|uniref:hypothetical protein n=1 Tax=Luteitalea sp. TaxID=2004800 RepID=UPI0025C3D0E9|nr:hypothetical protein [Luteitalea sp.]
MTRRLRRGALAILVGLLVGACLLVAAEALAQAPVSPLTAAKVEAHRLRVENAQLRAQLAQVQAALDSERLTAERLALEQLLRDELHPPEGHVFDWIEQRFIPPQEPK